MSDEKIIEPLLLDLMIDQADRREKMGAFAETENDEIGAMLKLCRATFGDTGLLEAGPEEPGIIYMGYYIDPPSVPSHRRRRKLLFRGAKYREILAQVVLWKAKT